jgi:hypothetical protein
MFDSGIIPSNVEKSTNILGVDIYFYAKCFTNCEKYVMIYCKIEKEFDL